MFQFPGFPPFSLSIRKTVTELFSAGFPHSDICGSMSACDSPQLFAAGRVLLRRLVPWHPPCALLRLISLLRPTFGDLPPLRLPASRLLLPTLTGLRLSLLPCAVVKMRRRTFRRLRKPLSGILKTIRDQFLLNDLSLPGVSPLSGRLSGLPFQPSLGRSTSV